MYSMGHRQFCPVLSRPDLAKRNGAQHETDRQLEKLKLTRLNLGLPISLNPPSTARQAVRQAQRRLLPIPILTETVKPLQFADLWRLQRHLANY